MADEKKRRGRPPLTDEQREERRIIVNRKQAERLKKNGYAAQKRYRANHPQKRNVTYEPKVHIPIEYKATVYELLKTTGLSFTQLCITAIEEKYGITFSKSLDKSENK